MYKEMRKLSNSEKEFVDELLVFTAGNNLEKLQMGRIISDKINFHGIKCNTSTKTVEIYKTDEADANISYTILMGLFSFLYELKEYGYIGIDTIVDKDGTIEDATGKDSFWIYNHTTHAVDNDLLFVRMDNDVLAGLKEDTPIEQFHSKDLFDAMKDLVYNKIIYPCPALKELQENSYRSIEEKRHSQILCMQWVAIFVAILIPMIVAIYTNCRGTQIHSIELQQIEKKIDNLNKVSIVNSDTLQVESISIGQQRKSLQNISQTK